MEDIDGPYAISIDSIRAAASTIRPYTHRTPVFTCSSIDELAGRELFFKCECFQKGGAFKFRGACNAVLTLPEAEALKGVVTHSSGNHGAALARAARLRGIRADIVVPDNTPACKTTAISEYKGHVTVCPPTMDAREAACATIQHRTDAVFIHPYNDPRVMSGQGTIALELLEQVEGGLDAIVVPVSGGGMISGIAVAAKALKPDIVIIAAEPTGSNDAADVAAAKLAGKLVPLEKPHTIADGLHGRLGSNTWPIVRDLVAGVITVSEAEIVGAMRLCFERMKVVVEPSGAVGLAAVLSPQLQQHAQWCQLSRVGVILCGGNCDFASKGFWDSWL